MCVVGWLDESRRYERPEPVEVCGLRLLRAGLPPDCSPRLLRRALKALGRQGVRRVLLPPRLSCRELPDRYGLSPVDPLPLCRTMAPRLAQALLDPLPPRQRTVALWGGGGGMAGQLRLLAEALCPQVCCLLLEEGRTDLAGYLRRRFGAVVLTLAQGPVPDLVVELAPGWSGGGKRLKLWGQPKLCGLVLRPGVLPIPPGADSLSLTALLWETGRVEIGQIQMGKGGVPLDINGK